MKESNIEWTDATWNPVTGCNKVSSGCKNCYAERMAHRLQRMRSERYKNGFSVTLHPDLIDAPRQWTRPRRIFVNSMSDLFHPEIPLEFILQVFTTMLETPQHTYQILTKRSSRLCIIRHLLPWPSNVWIGVSVENNHQSDRVNHLRHVPTDNRFLSCEPLLGPLTNVSFTGIAWVIVGGESGPKARPMDPQWVRDIRDRCAYEQIPFFFKQWGGVRKHVNGRLLDGVLYDEYPISMQVHHA